MKSTATKADLIRQLEALGDPQGRIVLVHTSLRSVGCDARVLLDALVEHFTKNGGLLCIPTHTWHNLGQEVVMDLSSDDSCLGVLSRIALRDERGVRSLNPTHSVVVFGDGKKAKSLIADEAFVVTPTAPESIYGKLFSQKGLVLLLGVAHDKNTYLHAVDEILGTPNRMEEKLSEVFIRNADGSLTPRAFKLFECDYSEDISHRFPKFETAFRYHRCIRDGFVGNAPAQLCDAEKMKAVMELLYRTSGADPLKLDGPIPPKWYCD